MIHQPKLHFFSLLLTFLIVTAIISGSALAHTPTPPTKEPVGPAPIFEDSLPFELDLGPDPFPANTTTEITPGAWRNLRPTESYLRDVSMLPPEEADEVDCQYQSKGWTVGDNGVILGYCQGVWDHAIKSGRASGRDRV